MRLRTGLQNFILWLLLLVLTVAAASAVPVSGHGDRTQRREESALCSAASRPSDPVDFWAKQTFSNRSELTLGAGMRRVRTVSYRGTLLLSLFHILTLLSVYSLCSRQRLILHGARFIYKKSFTISFMQDMDGRKRLLSI